LKCISFPDTKQIYTFGILYDSKVSVTRYSISSKSATYKVKSNYTIGISLFVKHDKKKNKLCV